MAYSSITKPSDYFDTTLITGNGSTQNITGLGFQPDWIWMKRRNATGHNRLIDSVRGSNKLIQSDLANAEGTDATYVTSFNSDGWSIGTNTDINGTGGTAVGWSWLAGGSASSNTDGSITSSVSANTTSGFSIVSYTGTAANATVGHGLGAAPQVIFVKNRSAADDWAVYNYHIGATKYLRLNQNTAEETGAPMWNSTHPTSSVFSVGTYHNSNGPSENMIAYCFAEKKGYSKFGKYFGNNNTNGPFIYTGFKPAYVLFKIHSGTTGEWTLFDNKRDPFNEVDNRLFPSTSGQEADGNDCDFLSNGFKVRTTGSATNGNGYEYIYMAFAEHPLVANVSGGIPATAR